MEKIKNFENYMVSKDGNVFSIKSNKYLKSRLCNAGYLMLVLRTNGMSKNMSIHRLVASTYLSNDENKKCVNHKNGIKTDNRVENLEWVTYKENIEHSIRVLGNPKPPTRLGQFGYEHNRSVETHKYCCNSLLFICSYGSISEASRDAKCHVSTLHLAVKNKSKTRRGFYYSYNKMPHFEIK